MDSSQIKIFLTSEEFKKTCIKNNISLFKFKYLEFNTNSNLSSVKKYPFIYMTIWKNRELIGVLKQAVFCGFKYNDFQISPNRTILYVSINEDYYNQGYSKKIIESYFKFLNKNNIIEEDIHISPYSQMGWNFLKKNLHIIANKYNLIIKDKNYCYEL